MKMGKCWMNRAEGLFRENGGNFEISRESDSLARLPFRIPSPRHHAVGSFRYVTSAGTTLRHVPIAFIIIHCFVVDSQITGSYSIADL